MSTDHQKYSTENQSDAIRAYAAKRGIDIVRTYADEGKSGLTIDGRDALKSLIDDVQRGRADFTTLLVYDVSRWGRFQDADEGAHYEYVCKRADISVQYCAEQFENDGSPVSTIVKGVKRAMAGEYSRELSAKVFTGQCRLIALGYRQGGAPGYGLRRQLIDQFGNSKGILSRGDHKCLQTDRVILVPGPIAEVETVRWVYEAFVELGHLEHEIAALLNAKGLMTDLNRPWTRGTVHQILINEKYVGNNVWNRRSFKLKKNHVCNPPDMWIRAEGAFEPIVSSVQFDTAQTIIQQRSLRATNEEMLRSLEDLLERQGYLSGVLIDEAHNLPSSSAYQRRFGSLIRAYSLVGYTPKRDFRYIDINRTLRLRYPEVIANTIAGIRAAGGEIVQCPKTDLLTVNREFTASVLIVRCREVPGGSLRWHVRFDTGLFPDITIAVRMGRSNTHVTDYYVLPRLDMIAPRLRLAENNGASLDCYRFENLERLFDMAIRSKIEEAA